MSDKSAIEQVRGLVEQFRASADARYSGTGARPLVANVLSRCADELAALIPALKGGSLCHCELCAYVRGNASEIRSLGPTDALKEMLARERDETRNGLIVALGEALYENGVEIGIIWNHDDDKASASRMVKEALAGARKAGRLDAKNAAVTAHGEAQREGLDANAAWDCAIEAITELAV